jgi:hypothetical protein
MALVIDGRIFGRDRVGLVLVVTIGEGERLSSSWRETLFKTLILKTESFCPSLEVLISVNLMAWVRLIR